MEFLGANIHFLTRLSSYTVFCSHSSLDIVFPGVNVCAAEESESWKCSKEERCERQGGAKARMYS